MLHSGSDIYFLFTSFNRDLSDGVLLVFRFLGQLFQNSYCTVSGCVNTQNRLATQFFQTK